MTMETYPTALRQWLKSRYSYIVGTSADNDCGNISNCNKAIAGSLVNATIWGPVQTMTGNISNCGKGMVGSLCIAKLCRLVQTMTVETYPTVIR